MRQQCWEVAHVVPVHIKRAFIFFTADIFRQHIPTFDVNYFSQYLQSFSTHLAKAKLKITALHRLSRVIIVSDHSVQFPHTCTLSLKFIMC